MKLAMFDVDGTLTESTAADGECYIRALGEVFGFSDVSDDWSAYPHCTDSGILTSIFQERRCRPPTASEIDEFQSRFIELLTSGASLAPFQPIPGACEFLNYLHAREDWRVSLASGAWKRSARLKLATARLPFADLSGAFADDAHSREEIMQRSLARALARLGRASFESVIYIGDGVWDAQACRSLGWPFVGIAREQEKVARLYDAGAQYVFPNLRELETVMCALDGLDCA